MRRCPYTLESPPPTIAELVVPLNSDGNSWNGLTTADPPGRALVTTKPADRVDDAVFVPESFGWHGALICCCVTIPAGDRLNDESGYRSDAGMSKCFLRGHGQCSGKISGEHYISESVLEAIGGSGTVQIGGLPWQPPMELKRIGIRSLVTNVLCKGHNSALSALDSAAVVLFRAIDATDKAPASLPAVSPIDGAVVERWFLKVLCGLAAGMGFNNGIVPAQWRDTLVGRPWPEGWGLYLPIPSGIQVLAPEISIETLVRTDTKEVKAAKFRVAGVHFSLLVGRPDDPPAWGTYHPQSLIFRSGSGDKRIEFGWQGIPGGAIEYTKVGTSTDRPPQWREWKE